MRCVPGGSVRATESLASSNPTSGGRGRSRTGYGRRSERGSPQTLAGFHAQALVGLRALGRLRRWPGAIGPVRGAVRSHHAHHRSDERYAASNRTRASQGILANGTRCVSGSWVFATLSATGSRCSVTWFPLRHTCHVGHEPGEQRRQVVLPPDESQWQRQLEIGDVHDRHAVRTSPAGRFHDEANAHPLGDERQYRRFVQRFLNDARRFQAATKALVHQGVRDDLSTGCPQSFIPARLRSASMMPERGSEPDCQERQRGRLRNCGRRREGSQREAVHAFGVQWREAVRNVD